MNTSGRTRKGGFYVKILVVDDEALLVKGIRFNLQSDGFRVLTGSTGLDAIRLVREEAPELVILDVMMPQMDGFTACRKIREFSTVPIIMLTAKSESEAKLEGFDCGADDYLTKPFQILELKARIRALLRRSGLEQARQNENLVSAGAISLDPNSRNALRNGTLVELTAREFDLILFLMEHPNQVFSREEPLNVTYGVGVPELDTEGRMISLEYPKFYLVTCYTPNAQRELARIDHRMKWDDAFRAKLAQLDGQKPVVVCGDLNVAHREIDLKNPASNRGNAGFSDQERDSFQKTLDMGFTDTFRSLYPEQAGIYSWWSYMFHAREKNAGWRIDYFLVSSRTAGQIRQAAIHCDILGSDHCPVELVWDAE